MKKMALIFVTSFFLLGCIESTSNLQFYEIFHERQNCDPYCSLEYIVLSNGFMLKKESHTEGFIQNEIEVIEIDAAKAVKAIEFVQSAIEESRNERCVNCNEFTLYLSKDEKPLMYAVAEEKAPEFLTTIKNNTSDLFLEGKPAEQFFAQFVFKRIGQNSVDYHFFPNGSVLKSEFGGDLTLKNVQVFDLETEKIDSLKQKFDPDFFALESGLERCFEKGMEYGYLEVKKGELYNFVWSCGALDTKADQIYNELLGEYG